MEEFKSYYRFPLKMWNDFSIKVFTQDNNMAFDWLLPSAESYQEVKEILLAKINGEEVKPFKVKKTFFHEGSFVYCRFEEGEKAGEIVKIFRTRGWGMLIGVGGFNLDADKAAKIQNEFTEYCVDKLNGKQS